MVYLPTFGVFLGANVGKYSIHGAYGYIYIYICFGSVLRTYFPYVPLAKIYFPADLGVPGCLPPGGLPPSVSAAPKPEIS